MPCHASQQRAPVRPPNPEVWALIFQRWVTSMASDVTSAAPMKNVISHTGAWSV